MIFLDLIESLVIVSKKKKILLEEVIVWKGMNIYKTVKRCQFVISQERDVYPSQNSYCKVVIYNYVFVGFNSVSNLIVILFNLMYHVLHVGFYL